MSRRLTIARVIWAAIFGSTLVYIAVLELTTGLAEPSWEATWLPLAFAGVASAAGSLIVPQIVKRRHPSASKDPGRGAEPADAYLVTLISALALAEGVAILGLVLGLQGAPPKVVMPFFVVAWILMFIRFPTSEKLERFRVGP